MNIGEMHVMFRELAQQMGMQTTRAILPEDIDICLNIAIKDTVKELIIGNIGYINPNDKVSRHNNAISSINGLRTLMNKQNIDMDTINGIGTPVNPFSFDVSNDNVMLYLGFKIIYDNKYLYDCRIIEQENIGSTVQDFSNRPSKDAPSCTIIGDDSKITVSIINGIKNGTKPSSIQYLYIANPIEVYFEEHDSTNNVNSDMPEYLHKDIVEKAINIYLQSIGAVRKTNK